MRNLTISCLSILFMVSLVKAGIFNRNPEEPSFVSKGLGKVVGGDRAELGQFPWVVSIREYFDTGLLHHCGGAIIGDEWVLTAAHCCDITAILGYYIVAGGVDNFRNETAEEHSKVSRKWNHPDYDSTTFANDICLMKVDPKWEFTENLQPVSLPQSTLRLAENETVTLAGWGPTAEGGSSVEFLHYVDLPVVSDEQCNELFGNVPAPPVLDSMICAGDVVNGGLDACGTDAGGPYTYEDPNTNDTVIVGIVSWGFGCGRPGYPGVNTEVAYYIDWINDITNGAVTPPRV